MSHVKPKSLGARLDTYFMQHCYYQRFPRLGAFYYFVLYPGEIGFRNWVRYCCRYLRDSDED